MEGLEEFEKQLAADKAEREKSESSRDDRKRHRHRHHQDHKRHRDQDGHRRRRHHDVVDDPDHEHHKRRRRRSRDNTDERESKRHHDKYAGHGRDGGRDCSHDQDNKHSRLNSDGKTSEKQAGSPTSSAPVRDAWMTAPSALEIEHVHRPSTKEKTSATPKTQAQRTMHVRELNRNLDEQQANTATTTTTTTPPAESRREHLVDYVFGDAGSSWRMTKLRGVYEMAQDSGRPVTEVALERFGSLRAFDDAREEEQELAARRRAKHTNTGYTIKEKPTGDLHRERRQAEQEAAKARAPPLPSPPNPTSAGEGKSPAAAAGTEMPPAPMDQTALNRMRAKMMKAKLKRAPDAAQLEEEYNRAAAAASSATATTTATVDDAPSVVLGGMESRLLAGRIRNEVKPVDTRRGRERGTVVANDDMTIDDMLREERRTKGQAGGEGMRLAERIARDARFDDNLEYLDENAAKLAKHVHRSEMDLKNMAAHEFQRLRRDLDACPLCHHDDDDGGGDETRQRPPLAPVIALGTRVFLTLPTLPEVSPGGAVIVPATHHRNLLGCDDDEWEEVRNFMKALTRMYHAQGRDVLFYENAAAASRPGRQHAAMTAVPIPYEQGAVAPAYFREALLAADEEWSQHRKIIDTGAAAAAAALGRAAFRRSLPAELPYFHVWFTLDGGLGHVVEDARRWPRGDLFAREVVGGIVGAEPHVVKRQGRWRANDVDDAPRIAAFKKEWRKYDWTRVLVEES